MDQIDQIKDILFSNEKRALDALTRRLDTPDSRAADTADILPESIARSHAKGEQLSKALRAPVQESIKASITRDPQSFATTLSPVVGRALRQALVESIKAFARRINQSIEEKFSLKSLKWRWQAKKSGLPYAQFLVNRKLEYRVEHVYLIHPETGLLIAHVHRPGAIRKNQASISSLFSVIGDFVKESHNIGNEGIIDLARIGKYELWTMHEQQAVLACVITGMPPRGLREQFIQELELMHLQYAELLESFATNTAERAQLSKALIPHLEDCLLELPKQDPALTASKGLGPFGLFALLALAALTWFVWQGAQLRQQGQALIHTLEAEPGLFVTSSEYVRGQIHIKGLRDILAPDPHTLATQHGIAADQLALDFRPFYSLDKDIQLQRLKQGLDIPAGVSMQLSDNGELSVSGEISADFKQQVEQKLQGMLGIQGLNFSAASFPDPLLLESAVAILQAPVSVKLSVDNAVLRVSGSAPYAWHQRLEQKREQITGLQAVDSSQLRLSELSDIEAIETELNNELIAFSSSTRLEKLAENKIPALGERLKTYGQRLEALGIEPEIVLTGYTDNSGNAKQDRNMQTERALYVKGRLVGQGVRSNWIFVRSGSLQGEAGVADPIERKVIINLMADVSAFK